MEILHFKDLGDTSVVSECSLGVNLVIDHSCYVVADTSPLYTIWKQSDHYLWRYCILTILGIRVSFGCERSCSSPRRVSNFNSKVSHVGIYPHIQYERDRLNILRVRVFTSSWSTGGCDAKTIISPNTSFGDIINNWCDYVWDGAVSAGARKLWNSLLVNNRILYKWFSGSLIVSSLLFKV